jgi:hypothetical protein
MASMLMKRVEAVPLFFRYQSRPVRVPVFAVVFVIPVLADELRCP